LLSQELLFSAAEALLSAMALTAQIKLQQRTILQLVFSRFNQGLDAVRTLR